jgi:hypothetical protein
MTRRIISPVLFLALAACAHNPTPGARTCTVLNTETQLDSCVGKTVTIRGRVSPDTSILSVHVDAPPDLVGNRAHATGLLERSGDQFTLKSDGALAKAHALR